MAGLSSPLRFFPPISPGRAASPTTMTASRRLGRAAYTSEESHIRDLSPTDTLRAFTEQPIPFDTTDEEYKIFACIDTLTHAEKDLGARIAKAAQRLQMWCSEIEQWGWSGTYEQPSEEYREDRRRSVELHVMEHVKDPEDVEHVGPLEYWGSLLSEEVEAHDARLQEIASELPALDFEELKEHVMNIHKFKSRPTSSGYGAGRGEVQLMDDFSILVTQTVVSALPYHTMLISLLRIWGARVNILRAVPQYLDDLRAARNTMRSGWQAIEPPSGLPDAESLNKWKEAVDKISSELKEKLGDLGRRVDRMLDLKEETEQLPDEWIDDLEALEKDFANWSIESRQRIMAAEVLSKASPAKISKAHSDTIPPSQSLGVETSLHSIPKPRPELDGHVDQPVSKEQRLEYTSESDEDGPKEIESSNEDETVLHNEVDDDLPEISSSFSSMVFAPQDLDNFSDTESDSTEGKQDDGLPVRPHTPLSPNDSVRSLSPEVSYASSPASTMADSPSVSRTTNRQARLPKPPLNSAMTKRRVRTNSNGSDADSNPPWPPTQFSNNLPANADELDRKISDILTTIPTNIRLKSGPPPDPREMKPAKGVTRNIQRGYLRPQRSITGMRTPEITLAAARQDPDGSSNYTSGRRSHVAVRGDNDIKLYHLTQPGKEKPTKLYIRRVGENGERVMVRVGGGWADLGEYLRQYAEHHGRRTVSEGKFEVLGLAVKSSEVSPRPGSAMGRRRSSGPLQTTPQKPTSASLLNDESILEENEAEDVPSIITTPALTTTGDGSTSAPSTCSSRLSWTGPEVGLAGPKIKKVDLPREKTEWIEEMLHQAKRVSSTSNLTGVRPDTATSTSGERSDSSMSFKGKHEFGDLGKVGGTKRVFMRGGEH